LNYVKKPSGERQIQELPRFAFVLKNMRELGVVVLYKSKKMETILAHAQVYILLSLMPSQYQREKISHAGIILSASWASLPQHS